MPQHYLMGLDIGGGGGRCLLVDAENGHIVTAHCAWTQPVAPGTGGWGFDLDVAASWNALGDAAREAMAWADVSPEHILGVAATSMRHAVVLLDQDGREIFAVPNRDARAATEGMALANEHGATLHERTGHWPSPICPAARLRWLAANAPAIWEQARWFLNVSDWVAYRLTGEVATDHSQAAETSLYDLAAREWAWNLIDLLGLPRDVFPPIAQTGTRLGVLTEEAANLLGMRPGIPVAVGGADTQCGLLGAGVVASGQMGAIAGTTTSVQYAIDQPIIDPDGRIWTGCHVMPDLWVMESNAGGMGEALDWLAGMLYPDAAYPVLMLVTEAAKSEPGAAGMLSTIGGQIFNAKNFGLPMGNLTLTYLAAAQDPARRRHLARAVLEGMAYSLRANAEQILAVAGAQQPPLALAGGMVQSAVWPEIVGDVINTPVSVPTTPQASGLGAAISAGVAAGVFDNLTAGAEALAGPAYEHTPDLAHTETYQMLYQGWNQVCEAREEADELAAGLALDALLAEQDAGAAATEMLFRPRILITSDMDEVSLATLRTFAEVKYASYREVMRLLMGDELVEELTGYHILITEVDVVDSDALTKLPDLRAIVVCRGSVVNVDVNACTLLGIPVLNTPGRNADAVADLTIAFILMLIRRMPEAVAFLQTPGGEAGDMARMGQSFNALQGQELWRKTVGMVGLGAVGRAVAGRLRPFGPRILVYDPYVSPEQIALAGAEPASLDAVIEESDVISLHAAVTDETRGMIDAEAFARMKPGALLVNTARAALLDEDALIEALQSDRLGGAALDVFAVEPPGSDHPLLAMPNVVATPHVGGNTTEVSAHQGQIIVDEVTLMLRGLRPRHILNPETWEEFSWEEERQSVSGEILAKLAAGPGPAVSDLQVEDEEERIEAAEEKKGSIRSLFGKRKRGVEAAGSGPGGGYQMERLLAAFLHNVRSDPKLRDFSTGKHVIMHFTLPDIGMQFYIAFANGEVLGDLGEPPETAHARLKMAAEILDGMFTGQTNPTRAAMSGKISFSGDTAKAMTLQRIQKDLTRLYSQARDEVGGPGVLSVAAMEASAPAPAAAPGASAIVRVGDARDEIIDVINELYHTQLITATGGNLSVRIPNTDQIWITPSQLYKGDLRPDLMVRLDVDGQGMDPDAPAPSSEWPMHCAIYRARSDFEAIIHTHAPQATLLVLSGLPFLPISTESAFLGNIPRVPFIMPGTTALADAMVEALGEDHAAVLMQNHGMLVGASSLRRAANVSEIIERTSELILGCHAAGVEPPTLPDDVVAQLRELGKMMA